MIRYRWAVVAVWLVVLLGGGYASTKLSGLLANTFTVPGTDSERVRTVLSSDFGDRSDGSFTVVFQLRDGLRRLGVRSGSQARLDGAAHVVPTGQAHELRVAGPARALRGRHLHAEAVRREGVHGRSPESGRHAAGRRARLRDRACGDPARPRPDLQLRSAQRRVDRAARSRYSCCWPCSGSRAASRSRSCSPARRSSGTLGIVYLRRARADDGHVRDEPRPADRPRDRDRLLAAVVYRFREELERRARSTTRSCGRWRRRGARSIFSGATVAIGLALLLAMPMPFMRSMGVGGFLIPLVSIAAAATLQPALLSLYGRRGTSGCT